MWEWHSFILTWGLETGCLFLFYALFSRRESSDVTPTPSFLFRWGHFCWNWNGPFLPESGMPDVPRTPGSYALSQKSGFVFNNQTWGSEIPVGAQRPAHIRLPLPSHVCGRLTDSPLAGRFAGHTLGPEPKHRQGINNWDNTCAIAFKGSFPPHRCGRPCKSPFWLQISFCCGASFMVTWPRFCGLTHSRLWGIERAEAV